MSETPRAYPAHRPTIVRRTVARDVTRAGVGVHLGLPARVTLCPAAFGQGIAFVTPRGRVPADPDHARAGAGRLVLQRGEARVDTVEHLLAACSGLGITDLDVAIDGPEVPILDGAAAAWVAALREAGRRAGPPDVVRELPEVAIAAAGGRARCGPGPDRLDVVVDFGPEGPRGRVSVARDEAGFLQIAHARTFVLASQVEALRAAGRGRGATPADTLVWAPGAESDEPVRHKALDAWGDLAVLGPVAGRVVVERGSHALHQALVAAVARAWATGPRG